MGSNPALCTWQETAGTLRALIKGLFSEVWAGLRYFTSLQVEPTYLLTAPNLTGQQKQGSYIVDPGKQSWSHGRLRPQGLWLRSAATARTGGSGREWGE